MSRTNNPFNLSQEEINELTKLWDEYNITTDYGGNPNHHGGPPDWYGEDWYREAPIRRKHEYIPILLIRSTVYTCKHCGAKKEETEGAYCEEEF